MIDLKKAREFRKNLNDRVDKFDSVQKKKLDRYIFILVLAYINEFKSKTDSTKESKVEQKMLKKLYKLYNLQKAELNKVFGFEYMKHNAKIINSAFEKNGLFEDQQIRLILLSFCILEVFKDIESHIIPCVFKNKDINDFISFYNEIGNSQKMQDVQDMREYAKKLVLALVEHIQNLKDDTFVLSLNNVDYNFFTNRFNILKLEKANQKIGVHSKQKYLTIKKDRVDISMYDKDYKYFVLKNLDTNESKKMAYFGANIEDDFISFNLELI